MNPSTDTGTQRDRASAADIALRISLRRSLHSGGLYCKIGAVSKKNGRWEQQTLQLQNFPSAGRRARVAVEGGIA
jgi:hypothetical protein